MRHSLPISRPISSGFFGSSTDSPPSSPRQYAPSLQRTKQRPRQRQTQRNPTRRRLRILFQRCRNSIRLERLRTGAGAPALGSNLVGSTGREYTASRLVPAVLLEASHLMALISTHPDHSVRRLATFKPRSLLTGDRRLNRATMRPHSPRPTAHQPLSRQLQRIQPTVRPLQIRQDRCPA